MRGAGLRRAVSVLTAACLVALLAAGPASAGGDFSGPGGEPDSQTQPATGTANPAPTRSCSLYGSSSGFGMLCSGSGTGQTLAQLVDGLIDPTKPYCWDGAVDYAQTRDRGLPDGFSPPYPARGAEQWWLRTCLSFVNRQLDRQDARLTYEFVTIGSDAAHTLTGPEAQIVRLFTGRGQIPFLAVQTSPVSSPRVGQDVAFSLLCDDRLVDCSGIADGRVETPRLSVGGVVMWAELLHTTVRPLGAGRPDVTGCDGAGLVRTAEQLDAGPAQDPRVCRYTYERSSAQAGGGASGDRYPAQVTAFWQIWYDETGGSEADRKPLGAAFAKTTINPIRVTEVQTLVVS